MAHTDQVIQMLQFVAAMLIGAVMRGEVHLAVADLATMPGASLYVL
jgi:hypothetical protein